MTKHISNEDFEILQKAKNSVELTDEEIEKIFWEIANQPIKDPMLSFARAILKKAKEK
jgi:hypothetical protein